MATFQLRISPYIGRQSDRNVIIKDYLTGFFKLFGSVHINTEFKRKRKRMGN